MPRDRTLLLVAVIGFALWLVAAGPLRSWASASGLRSLWVLGVAPSFWAGFTLTCWQAFGTRTGPLVSAAFALALVTLAEGVQLLLPRQTPDVWDITAGAMGAALAAPIVWARNAAGGNGHEEPMEHARRMGVPHGPSSAPPGDGD